MKVAIIYCSKTGNTKLIADKVKEEIELLENYEIIYFGTPKENIEADIFILGSWTDKGMCDEELLSFIKTIKDKKILYFGTAGFGGNSEYYDSLYSRIALNIDSSNEILGYFFCQGKMPMQVRERYVQMMRAHPDDKKLEVNIENFDKALSHPDEKDIKNVKNWIKDILNK